MLWVSIAAVLVLSVCRCGSVAESVGDDDDDWLNCFLLILVWLPQLATIFLNYQQPQALPTAELLNSYIGTIIPKTLTTRFPETYKT